MAGRKDYFERPTHPLQVRYEALRAIEVDDLDLDQAAKRFGYKSASLRVILSRFRAGELDPFLATGVPGSPARNRPDATRKAVLEARRHDLSIEEIPAEVEKLGIQVSPMTAWRILRDAGLERLPKRSKKSSSPPSLPPTVANVQHLDLEPRTIACRAPLTFLFAPLLARLDFDDLVTIGRFPGTTKIPATEALRSLLCLKLLNRPRKNHVATIADDEGFGLLAGLNCLPKTTALSTYSHRVGPQPIRALQQGWIRAYQTAHPFPSASFNFDFHAIRHYGESDASSLEKNYVPRRSQSVPSILVAFAQEQRTRTLVYANANLLKREKNDAILTFVEHWRTVTGANPKELAFDAQATTHTSLAKLDAMGITFLTLRARQPKEIRRLAQVPADAWTQVELDAPGRKWRTPTVLDEHVAITDYPKPIRQIALNGLGHEEPTLLLTNDERRGPAKLFERNTQRTPIENSIGEQVGFFHVDALTSDVRLKVDLDITLSVIASNAYHWLASQLKGYEAATPATIWRTFLDRPGHIVLTKTEAILRVPRFAKAPALLESQAAHDPTPIPWLGDRRLRLQLL
ncbi:MAG: transposase family protein [Thermoplasmatota archaeon]